MYYTYLVTCADNTLYTGITTALTRRIKQHNGELKGGAKYTRSRRPVTLLYFETYVNASLAKKREYEIKQYTHEQKQKLCTVVSM